MIDPRIFATVFGTIFLAELPDKTAVAALVLATRHRAMPVFLGTALALVVQSVVAVAAGGLLSLLPARPVHIGAGILFLVSAIFMWRREEEEETKAVETGAAGFRSAFGKSFLVVFIAEWGDLTQLGTAALAANYRAPLTVFLAASVALCLVAALAVFVGNRLSALIHPRHTQRVAAVVFVLLGLALIWGKI
ncbi:MAG TPA: TMEM165/GDT1 family protein [Polyangiaceae bacterium]|jgi:putative Ca2+/H+ antiporter (TMEM165/GDT1 family)|nr:TMEM165/GDT1 family protein [Polyangiaceae bacterium]